MLRDAISDRSRASASSRGCCLGIASTASSMTARRTSSRAIRGIAVWWRAGSEACLDVRPGEHRLGRKWLSLPHRLTLRKPLARLAACRRERHPRRGSTSSGRRTDTEPPASGGVGPKVRQWESSPGTRGARGWALVGQRRVVAVRMAGRPGPATCEGARRAQGTRRHGRSGVAGYIATRYTSPHATVVSRTRHVVVPQTWRNTVGSEVFRQEPRRRLA